MGSEEQPLIERLIAARIAAHLAADARRGQAVADAVDHVLSAHDIAARGRKAAAGVLDQAAHAHVRAKLGGLLSADKFAIAVIHHEHRVGKVPFEHLRQGCDVLGHEAGARGIAPAALHGHHAGARLHGCADGGKVQPSVRAHGHLGIAHTHFAQRSRRAAAHADHILQRVIGAAGGIKQLVAGPEQPEQAH